MLITAPLTQTSFGAASSLASITMPKEEIAPQKIDLSMGTAEEADNVLYVVGVLAIPGRDEYLVVAGAGTAAAYGGPFVSLMRSQTTDPTIRRQIPITASTAPQRDQSVAVAVANVFERIRFEYDEEDVASHFREQLRALIQTYGDKALETVGNVIKRKTTDPELVFTALQLLSEEFSSIARTIDIVSEALSSEDVEIRYGAALAVRQIGSERSVTRIEEVLQRESSPIVKDQLARALRAIQG